VSPVASPLVIAPKATPPYIRFCGDYVAVNKFIITHHGYIPNVEHEIQKIKGFTIFIDLDMANAFHQLLLGPVTSARLSVVTPWGQYQPRFMPEGVAPASILLQDVMREIFSDFHEWAVIIFDNILLLAHNYQDAYDKLERFLQRCKERNIVLKLSKSFFGFSEVKFFGYLIRHDSYELGEDRKGVIERLPFPRTVKETQSFLGVSIFFQRFVPNYAVIVAPLYDMTKQSFNWDRSTWTIDYNKVFGDAKVAILASLRLFFPDYSLRWVVRTDASLFGVGGVLFQVFIDADGVEVFQPIAFVSKKFSEAATKWATIQQECYGIYFTLHKLQYYVRGKFFELETDHANLQWMEASENPMIVRMRVFVQGLVRVIRHISAVQNKLADFFSRYQLGKNESSSLMMIRLLFSEELSELRLISRSFDLDNSVEELFPQLAMAVFSDNKSAELVEKNSFYAVSEEVAATCKQVHNARVGHMGSRKTWVSLNKHFPGHNIPFAMVEEFIMSCPVCQKDRLRVANSIPPIYRTIKPASFRKAIGVDNVSITPADILGNAGATVVVNLFSGHSKCYPYKNISAENTAISIFQYIANFGLFDEIHTDPGVDFKSKLVSMLEQYLGVLHIFSLVDRHESNGVERVIQEVLRHLKAIVFEERVLSKWSSPTILPVVEHIINNTPLSERGGYTAFQLTFGSQDQSYYILNNMGIDKSKVSSWAGLVKELDENISLIREVSKKYQDELVLKRSSKQKANQYQPGDFVTIIPKGPFKSAKLLPRYKGPYEVIKQIKNDVSGRHLAMGGITDMHVEDLQLFVGSRDQALEAANWDADQYVVESITAHKGDPWHRTTMEFFVTYADGDQLWMRFNTDNNNISKTVIFEEYCYLHPELRVLTMTTARALQYKASINRKSITELKPGDIFYLDLRTYGYLWYEALKLPDAYFKTYVTTCYVESWERKNLQLHIKDQTLNIYFLFRKYEVVTQAYRRELNESLVLVDAQLLTQFPQILEREL
jgi:hypothetical protein